MEAVLRRAAQAFAQQQLPSPPEPSRHPRPGCERDARLVDAPSASAAICDRRWVRPAPESGGFPAGEAARTSAAGGWEEHAEAEAEAGAEAGAEAEAEAA